MASEKNSVPVETSSKIDNASGVKKVMLEPPKTPASRVAQIKSLEFVHDPNDNKKGIVGMLLGLFLMLICMGARDFNRDGDPRFLVGVLLYFFGLPALCGVGYAASKAANHLMWAPSSSTAKASLAKQSSGETAAKSPSDDSPREVRKIT